MCSPSLLHDAKHPLVTPADLKHHVLPHYADLNRGTLALDWSMWLQSVGLANLESAEALHFSHYDQIVLAAVNGQGGGAGAQPLGQALHTRRYAARAIRHQIRRGARVLRHRLQKQ